jgi:hypothetical protein
VPEGDEICDAIPDPVFNGFWGWMDGQQDLFELAENTYSPLILDLDGDGVETLGQDFYIHFDHDKNGFAERTGWVGADDGLLVLDRNGNGRIDNGGELFGNHSGTGPAPANGFAALAEFDSNRDGRIDASDAAFANLRVWKAANSNGLTDAGELLTLQQAGVGSLSLSYTTGSAVDAQGNSHLQLGSYTTTQGETRQMTDVWFSVDTMRAGVYWRCGTSQRHSRDPPAEPRPSAASPQVPPPRYSRWSARRSETSRSGDPSRRSRRAVWSSVRRSFARCIVWTPPFTPQAGGRPMRLDMGGIHCLHPGVPAWIGQFGQDAGKDPQPAPADPAAIKRRVRTIGRRRITSAQPIAIE